jgi:hypothetical protein
MIVFAIAGLGVALGFAWALLDKPDDTFPGSFLKKPESW